jgi:phage protein D
MTLIAIAAEAAERTDLVSVILSILGGGSVALASQRILVWAAQRKRKGAGRYGWKWGTWFAVVDLEANEKELAEAKAAATAAKEEAAAVKAEAAREMERSRSIQREAEARVAKAEALTKQCQEHATSAIRERDRLALKIAQKEGQ